MFGIMIVLMTDDCLVIKGMPASVYQTKGYKTLKMIIIMIKECKTTKDMNS